MMKKELNMNKLEKIVAKIKKTHELLEKLNQDYYEARRELSASVVLTQKGYTYTLTHGKKQYKVTKNGRGRYCVKLNGKVLDGDYTRGMHDLKYDIATGKAWWLA